METNKLSIDNALVDSLVSTETGKATLESLAQRLRGRNTLDLVKLKRALVKQGEQIDELDYKAFWQDLAKAGAGSVAQARGRRPERFTWTHNMRKVASDILGRSTIAKEKRKPRQKRSVVVAAALSGQFVIIPLRPDFRVEIKLPNKMTKAELRVIQDTLATMAA